LGGFVVLAWACSDGGGSNADGGGPDVAASDAARTDASDDVVEAAVEAGPACDLAKPFGTPQPLTSITTPTFDENGIWLMPDMLYAYVSAKRADSGSFDIFTASRSAVDASFGPLVPLTGPVNTSSMEEFPVVTADNLTMYYFTTANDGMYVASRANVSAEFGAGSPVAAPLASPPNEAISWISADGLTIYISSLRVDHVHSQIMVATRTSTAVPFDAPTTTGMPNDTTAGAGAAVLTSDQLTMYFTSDKNGGKNNVWKATRSTTADGFGAATLVDELNGTSFNMPSWISPDGCTIYVVQQPVDAGNTYDVLVASKPAP
jgi:hypothetical protein